MFEALFIDRGTIARYRCEPLLEERLSSLRYCAQEGARPLTRRMIAAAQITLIRLLDLRAGERVSVPRIEAPADRRSSRPAQPRVRRIFILDVRPTGSRGWIQRLTIRGRRTELGLGGFPLDSAQSQCAGDPQGGESARTGQSARFSNGGRKANREHGHVGTAPDVEDRGGAARLPVEFPGLGGGGDGSSARGGEGGIGAQGPQPD